MQEVRKIVPPLLEKFHKGQLGRVLVIGGSEDYTGAPYFAAMAAAQVGADMSHILCTKSAAPIIKTYSPNLMVHPYLHNEGDTSTLSEKVAPLLDRMHVVLIGPGLGRCPTVFSQIERIISLCAERRLPLVVDADGLYLAQQKPKLISEYANEAKNGIILTPNVVEYGRLLKATGAVSERDLALQLHCTLLVKGAVDVITDGDLTIESTEKGSPRRVSGQGDTLSGSLAAFVAFTVAHKNQLWETEKLAKPPLMLAALGASSTTRRASRLAFEHRGRAMLTTDVNNLVGDAFGQLFPLK